MVIPTEQVVAGDVVLRPSAYLQELSRLVVTHS